MTRPLAFLLVPALVAAQRAPAIPLKPANATLAEEFSRIRSVRELADGRVLIGDERERRLVVADLRSGKVDAIARIGSGPGEYRSVGQLFVLTGDSTLMPDWGSQRWLVLDGAAVAVTMPPESPAIRATNVSVTGADVRGHVLGVVFRRPVPNRPFDPTDSMLIVLVKRTTGRADTVGRIRSAYERGRAFGTGEVYAPPLAVGEQALLFLDGWMAIARLEPYQVDWRSPDGRTIRGTPLPFTVTKVNEREKRAYLAREEKAWGRAPQYAPNPVWPENLPPFERDALLAAPDGTVLVRRLPSASVSDTRYDVVDRRGALVRQISLPENRWIVGFGRRAAYLAVTDDDRIQRIERHPWP